MDYIEFLDYLSSYFTILPDNCVVLLDTHFQVLAASAVALDYFCVDLDDILKKDIRLILQKNKEIDNLLYVLIDSTALSGQAPTAIFPWQLFPVYKGKHLLGWALHQKTDRKVDESTEQLLEYLEKISALMPGNFYWKDYEGHYLGCNAALLEALNFSKEDLIGKTDLDLWPNQAKQLRHHDHMVMTTGKLLRLQESVTLGTEEHFYSVVKIPLHNNRGDVIGIMGNSLDITEQIKLQHQLVEEKEKSEAANRAKSDFIANMSHDLRTPMVGIMGMLSGLRYLAEDAQASVASSPNISTEKLKEVLQEVITRTFEYVDVAVVSSDELTDLFNEILETVRLESGIIEASKEAFDFPKLIQRSVNLLQGVAQHRKLNLSIEIDNNIPRYLKGFRSYLNRSLSNLISNALKFTEKGYVKVIVSLADQSPNKFCKGDTVMVKIQVKDSGVGIPEDKFDLIFEHFSRLTPSFQGLYKGTGLGLSAVKNYVQTMNGKIAVDSEVGKGACFTVTLPLIVDDHADRTKETAETLTPKAQTTTLPQSTTLTNIAPKQAKAKVLLVEDNPPAALAGRMVLKRLNCAVDTADTGESALTKASQKQYDLIFMDIGLPGMDGVETTKKIRALADTQLAQVPIVALTGHAGDDVQRQKCLSAGINDVLSKPAQPLSLQSALQKWVWDTSSPTKENRQSEVATKVPTELNTLTVIDWKGCVNHFADDTEGAHNLLSILAEDLKKTKATLTNAYIDQDAEALRAELHRCLGGVVYVRVPQLEYALRAFQTAVKADPQDPQQLEKTYQEFQKAIQNYWDAWEKQDFKSQE